ncbi:MAG: ATPase domain-containing protein [Halobacteriota archaeon]
MLSSNEMERIRTYIERLDDQLEGGIPKGTSSLICGVAGSMKSSMAYSILYNNAVTGNLKGLYITLEQEAQTLKTQMQTLGLAKESEKLAIVDHKMIDKVVGVDIKFEHNSIKKVKRYVDDLLKMQDYDLIAIDPLNALYSLTTIKNPRREIHLFFDGLRETGITSFLISEMYPGDSRFGKYGVEEFLADAIIHLELRRERDMLERRLGIIKMRYTNHNLQYLPLFYNKDKFTIYTKEEIEL